MDFQFTSEQSMWRDVVFGFMDREFPREKVRYHDQNRVFPEELFRKMAGEGWLGLLIPEDHGGAGLDNDPVMFAIFCEAIGKDSLDTAACIMTSMFTATNVSKHGTPEQRERYLAPFLRGEAKFCISISEPQSGSDAAGARSTARLDGDEWVVNGSKVWCSGAHHPNSCIAMMLRTGEGRYDFSVLLVPNDAPGLEIQKMDTLVRRSLGTTSLFMDNLRLPRSALLGEVNQGWKYIGEHLDYERLSIAASQVGSARTVLNDTANYLQERSAFGRKLSDFQVLKHRMAEDQARLSAAYYLVYAAASALARGDNSSALVAQAKLISSQTLFDLATNGMQALGGYAQLPEYDMERYFREAKHGMVGGGTNEILRSIIAKSMGL